MKGYNRYTERILPVMIEHNLILPNERGWIADFIRENSGDEEV